MKTIDEVKDEIAKKHGFKHFNYMLQECRSIETINDMINEAMQVYARVCCVEQSKNCKLAYQANQEYEQSAWVAEQIENAKLVTES